MEDGRIPNASITSNKPTFPATEAAKARLNNQGGWCSLEIDQLASLIVDLGANYFIDGIQTQGVNSYYKDVPSLCKYEIYNCCHVSISKTCGLQGFVCYLIKHIHAKLFGRFPFYIRRLSFILLAHGAGSGKISCSSLLTFSTPPPLEF